MSDRQRRWRRIAFAIGALGLAGAAVGGVLDFESFMRMWLVAALYWIAIPVGALPVLMTWHLTGGGWGRATEAVTRATIATLPIGAAAFLVPILFGLHDLYPWTADPATLEHVVRHKLSYLNVPFFIARTALFFAIWMVLAWRIEAWRRVTDPHPKLGAGGPIIWVLTTTFFCIDWFMSLEPHFYSDEFGLFFGAGLVVPAMAFILLAVELDCPARDQVDPFVSRMQDYANLTLAAMLGWVFFDFAQYLIIWMGNMPDEVGWFLHRSHGWWRVVTWIVLCAFFILPLFAFLFRAVKRSRAALVAIAALVLVGHYANCAWMVMPSVPGAPLASALIGAAAWIGIGAVWLGVFLERMAFVEGTEPAERRAASEAA